MRWSPSRGNTRVAPPINVVLVPTDDRLPVEGAVDLLGRSGSGPLWGMASTDFNATLLAGRGRPSIARQPVGVAAGPRGRRARQPRARRAPDSALWAWHGHDRRGSPRPGGHQRVTRAARHAPPYPGRRRGSALPIGSSAP